MNIESKVLNLFLHKRAVTGHTSYGFFMGYNLTSRSVRSWKEASVHSDSGGGVVTLGIYHGAEKMADLIREQVGRMHFSFPIAQINLHNEGNYNGGEKEGIPAEDFHSIHNYLRQQKPKIYTEPDVLEIPSH